jgi:hypothetical protein
MLRSMKRLAALVTITAVMSAAIQPATSHNAGGGNITPFKSSHLVASGHSISPFSSSHLVASGHSISPFSSSRLVA